MTKNELEMMKRTNEPSAKTALQVIIKNVLEDKLPVPINDFIKRLERKGVNVLFNQASTGYVSGIAYWYNGITITGSKLGNDFKWTLIKNRIDYNQERDRAIIQNVNTRTKSGTNQSSQGPATTTKSPYPGQNSTANRSSFTNTDKFDLKTLLGESSEEKNQHVEADTTDINPWLGNRKRRKKKRRPRL